MADGFWTALAPAMTPARGWTLRGARIGSNGTLQLAPSATPLACTSADIDGGIASFDPSAGLCAGRDPHGPAGGDVLTYYNGGRFQYGTLLSPRYAASTYDHAVASWVATTPAGTWLEAHLRVQLETGTWTPWYALPIWASGSEVVRRHSVDGQVGAATIATDTLVLLRGHVATAFQLAVTLFSSRAATPSLYRLSLATSRALPGSARTAAPRPSPVWGRDLPVPQRSQMLVRYRTGGYGGGGEAWCSPTSTAMILAYWARMRHHPELEESVPAAAHGTYDWTYGGTGNWPFNVAHAAGFPGMDGYVMRFPALSALEPWIGAGVPLALSIAYGSGDLPSAPLPSSAGHLLVLRGFASSGDPIVNDPAAPADGAVRRVYPRAALERAWLSGSGGTVYVIYPRGWAVPSLPPFGDWSSAPANQVDIRMSHIRAPANT